MGTLCTVMALSEPPRPPAPFSPPVVPRPEVRIQEPESGRRRTKATVLVVDDEPDVLRSLVTLLEEELENVQVVGTASANAAMARLSREHVDLLISDFRMPGMDGLELLSKARRQWPQMPTVLVSAYADEALAREAQKEGLVSLFVPKPLPLDAFVEAVGRLLDQPR